METVYRVIEPIFDSTVLFREFDNKCQLEYKETGFVLYEFDKPVSYEMVEKFDLRLYKVIDDRGKIHYKNVVLKSVKC